MLHPARWVALALSAHTFALAALAQSPLPDSFNPGASSYVDALAVQADGKILAGGYFTVLGGQSLGYVGRLNTDGALDTSFNPGASGAQPMTTGDVVSLALAADGQILVGGDLTALRG